MNKKADQSAVRLANQNDAGWLSEISKKSLRYFWSLKDFSDTLKNPQAKVFLYDNEVCNNKAPSPVGGYVVLYHAADEGEIASVGVHPALRRRGIGQSLLRALLSSCLDLGIKKIFLEVRESNEPAQRLYEKMGFLRVGVRKNFYDEPTEDAFIMMRKL